MPKKVVIIGGGTAGASAALAARKADRQASITVLAREAYPTYSRCGLPFAIGGVIPALENLIVFPEKVFAAQKIELKLNTEVTGLNAQTKEITYRQADKDSIINYDALVIASGSVPSVPGALLKVLSGRKYFVLRTIDDARRIMSAAENAKSALVIGASFIGLETAEALKEKYKLDVTLIEQFRVLWRMLDVDTSKMVREHLTAHGINVKENETLNDLFAVPESAVIIVSAGIRPETGIFKDAGVEIGPSGGIRTNEYLQTNFPDIYTAGDCAESLSGVTGEPLLIGLGTIAARQGVVAGANAALAPDSTDGLCPQGATPPKWDRKIAPIILNSSVLKLFGREIGSAGFTEEYCSKAGKISAISSLVKFPSLPHYYPGGSDVHVKLIADKSSGAVVGGQVIGESAVGARVNMLSLIIENRMTVSNILRSDFCYSPPVADIWEPITITAQALERIIKAKNI
ncbi:MAG: FAD-dependent oxidoreductase [Planctomycetota bacterium]